MYFKDMHEIGRIAAALLTTSPQYHSWMSPEKLNILFYDFQFQEDLTIHCKTGDLHITMVGKGVSPLVSLSPPIAENGVMEMGSVLAGEYLEKTFKVRYKKMISSHHALICFVLEITK